VIEGELNEVESLKKKPKVSRSLSSDQTYLRSRVINYFRRISETSKAGKAMKIVFGLMLFLHLCGMNSVLSCNFDVLQTSVRALEPYVPTAIFGVVLFVSTVIAILIFDRDGRRILLILCCAGMGACLLAILIRLCLLNPGIEIKHLEWIPLIAVNLYILNFSVGLGPIPWFMRLGLLSDEQELWVSSIAVCLNSAMAFLVTKFFPIMTNDFGSEAT
jgi:SP family facilitated glucose transporter-like MFS transporter 8